MATIKSYTDISQSKTLSKILPLESADMCYIKHSSSDNPNWGFNEDFPPMILGNVPINEMTVETLPCWSLAALLKIIGHYTLQTVSKDKKVFIVSEENYPICSDDYSEPVDACVDMIEKLHGLKML